MSVLHASQVTPSAAELQVKNYFIIITVKIFQFDISHYFLLSEFSFSAG